LSENLKTRQSGFAAEAGSTAADGQGQHIPFAAASVENIGTLGLEIKSGFSRLFRRVLAATDVEQRPIMSWQPAAGKICLVPQASTSVSVVASASQEDPLLVYLTALKSTGNHVLEDFVRRGSSHAKAADACKVLADSAAISFCEQTKATDTESVYQTFFVAFSKSRFTIEAKLKVESSKMPAPAPKPAVSVEASRHDLWVERNTIFHNNGYCFWAAKGKKYFGNANCHSKDVQLSGSEGQLVKQIKNL
jgi:hypothetical protein